MQQGARLRQRLGGTMGRSPDKKLYGRIWPNGNFSFGVGPAGQEALEMCGDSEGGLARWGDNPGLGAAVAALTSSNAPNSHTGQTERPQRGLAGITGHGQQMLRSACYLLERDYGNQDLCFATLTVPTLSKEGRRALAGAWSELVRQLVQWVSRKLASAGRPQKLCGCTEIQTARLHSRAEGYLHLHVVWPAHSNEPDRRWVVEWSEMRSWWENALVRFAGEALSHHPRVELAPVRKSAERYMGKYLSKGSGEALDEFVADLGTESVPPSWWFMSGPMRSQVKAEVVAGPHTGELLFGMVRLALESNCENDFEWMRPVMLEFDGDSIHVGWCGRLAPRARADALDLLGRMMSVPS